MTSSRGDRPLVSVVVPAYKPHFFRACLDSIYAQTYPNLEVIVKDDCPSSAIEDIARDYPGVSYSRNEAGGHYRNFDRCLCAGRGDYVKFLFDDDLMEPDCIERMVDAAQIVPEPGPGLIACAYEQIDEHGAFIAARGFDAPRGTSVMADGVAVLSLLYHTTNYMGSLSSVLIPAASRDALGEDYFVRRMSGGARGLSDVAMYLDLVPAGPVVYINAPLVKFRLSRFNLSNPAANANAVLTLTAWETLLQEAFDRGLLNRMHMRHALGKVAERYRRWEGSFPELAARRDRIEAQLALRGSGVQK